MSYQCAGIFMARIPSLPIKVLKDFDQSNQNVDAFIQNYKEINLDNFFEESLLISSQSLYRSLKHPPVKSKKIRNFQLGLTKYLIRSSTRPTPFGLLSGVALGKFSSETELNFNSQEYVKEVKPDTNWISHVICSMEKQLQVVSQLHLKWNQSCYQKGDRVKNPIFSSCEDTKSVVEETNIRFTPLIELIKKEAKEYISFYSLKKAIVSMYPNVSDDLINQTLLSLIENEFLFTELRIPAYCNDALGYIIKILQNKKNISILVPLIEIQKLIFEYQKSRDHPELLNALYQKMGEIHSEKNYVEVNKGIILKKNNLSYAVKNYLEKFINIYTQISPTAEENSEFSDFKKDFMEEYGTNIEVPLLEIIDDNEFAGLKRLHPTYEKSDYEKLIRSIFDRKILWALDHNEPEVKLTEKDFLPIKKFDCKNPAYSFDMNFFIVKDKADFAYRFIVGPNVGAPKAGMMFQRFHNVYDPVLINAYNQCYRQEIVAASDHYIIVEGREAVSRGRLGNIINCNPNHDFYLPMACEGGQSPKRITIDDLLIGLSVDQKLYIKSRSLNKKCKIIEDNMLNPNLNNRILYLLKRISDEYENKPVTRNFLLYDNQYVYVPRISLEGVILQLKQWNLGPQILDFKNLTAFNRDLSIAKTNYKINQFVYLCQGDNRLIIDLKRAESAELLYAASKKDQMLHLSEIEPGLLDNFLVCDETGNSYITEFTFSFFRNFEQEKISSIKSNLVSQNLVLIDADRQFDFCEKGWIYFKLFGIGTRGNEILKTYLFPLVQQLSPKTFFFIRYSNEGSHLRIRFCFENESSAINCIKKINAWICNLRQKNMINRVVFDTYKRETNRYGGIQLIEFAENYFYKDSIFVIKLLQLFDLDNDKDVEITYFTGIFSVLYSLESNLEDLFTILDSDNNRNDFREEFHANKAAFLQVLENVLTDHIEKIDLRFGQIREIYNQRKNSLLKFSKCMNSIPLAKLTNTKKDVILSLSHMYCNRLTGDMTLEHKYCALIHHSLSAYIKRFKNL